MFLEINERNCGSENKKYLGEVTSRREITKGGRSGGAAYLQCRGLQVARFASFDLLWSRKLEVLATPSLLRRVSQNGSEAAGASLHRGPWAKFSRKQVLARESHGAFSLPQHLLPRERNGRFVHVSQTTTGMVQSKFD